MAYSKLDKTIQAKKQYCRLATCDHDNASHYDFNPEFDLNRVIQLIGNNRVYAAMAEAAEQELLTFYKAITGPNKHHQKKSTDLAMAKFNEKKTQVLVKRPKDTLVLSSRWVFKIKKKLNRSVIYKSRQVIRGFK